MIPLIFLALLAFLLPSSFSQVSISLSQQTLSKSGAVNVKWSGTDSLSKLDWLGIYSPPNTSAHFIGYLFLSMSTTWKSGSGSVTVPLVNLRSSYKFRIFRWYESEVDPSRQDHDRNPLPGTKHLLVKSEEFEAGRGSEQVHLALTGQTNEMRVMFVTHDGKDSFVKYGSDRDHMDGVVGTQVVRYEREHVLFPS